MDLEAFRNAIRSLGPNDEERAAVLSDRSGTVIDSETVRKWRARPPRQVRQAWYLFQLMNGGSPPPTGDR